MGAYLSSFLDNPFEEIPTPVAPARPAVTAGNIIPASGMWNGQPITGIDQGGNLYGTSGTIIGTSPGTSSIDPASGRAGSLGIDTSNPAQYAHSPTGGYAPKAAAWIMSHLEDFVFILIGLILIAAGVFSFRGTQTVIKTAGKAAAEVAA